MLFVDDNRFLEKSYDAFAVVLGFFFWWISVRERLKVSNLSRLSPGMESFLCSA
jgi:hypothetical protein